MEQIPYFVLVTCPHFQTDALGFYYENNGRQGEANSHKSEHQ